MRRRDFIEAIIGATSTILWPLSAGAENALPVVGVLGTSGATDYNPMIAAFRKGLSEAGYVEGKNIWIEYRDLINTVASSVRVIVVLRQHQIQ